MLVFEFGTLDLAAGNLGKSGLFRLGLRDRGLRLVGQENGGGTNGRVMATAPRAVEAEAGRSRLKTSR